MFEHRIEHREQFSHTRGKGNLLGFVRAAELLIEGADHEVETGGDNRILVQHGPDLSAPALYRPPSTQRLTIPVKRGEATPTSAAICL